MSLTYKGHLIRRILLVEKQPRKELKYLVDTDALCCVVPLSAIGADGGIREIMQVADRTRGNYIQEKRS